MGFQPRSLLKGIKRGSGKFVGKALTATGFAAIPTIGYKAYKRLNPMKTADNYTGRTAANVLSGKIRMGELSSGDRTSVMQTLHRSKVASGGKSVGFIEKTAFGAVPAIKTMGSFGKKVFGLGMNGLMGKYYLDEFKKSNREFRELSGNTIHSSFINKPKNTSMHQNDNFLTRHGTAVKNNFY